MLTKDLLRVSRAGGGFQPRFAGSGDRLLAARVVGTFQGHVGETRGTLQDQLQALEREADDFKLVRGFAHLLEREATFETQSPVDPRRARAAAFAAAEPGVVTGEERSAALTAAGDELGADPDDVARSLTADRECREVLVDCPDRWDPDLLVAQYNLSLAQTALFDATEVRVRSDDVRGVVSAVKRLGLLYEVVRTDDGRAVELTGPDALFRRTRRYGTRFARLLRTVARAGSWTVEATIDDRGTERQMVLSDADPVTVPDADPVVEVSYDSEVERDFATRFSSLDLDWTLVREPEPLAAGDRLMIPDFAFDYAPGGADGDFRVFFEVMGFWTPEYVEKKLAQLDAVDGVDMVVAVDESLGVGEEIAARDHRVVTYSGTIPLKPVRSVLREYESDLAARQAADLPDALCPEDDCVGLSTLAARRGVSEDALADVDFPDHRRVGRALVRPARLDELGDAVEPGTAVSAVESLVADCDGLDASALLSALGYRVEWAGLGDGTVREA